MHAAISSTYQCVGCLVSDWYLKLELLAVRSEKITDGCLGTMSKHFKSYANWLIRVCAVIGLWSLKTR